MLTDEAAAVALVAVHDDVQLSLAAVMTSPPPRTRLLSHPDDDAVDAFARMARERPVIALGIALTAELLYGESGSAWAKRAEVWRSLGETPLDVAAHELQRTQGGGGAP